MGIYTTYKCPKCGRGLEYLVPHKSRGVGEPFRQCQKCQSVVNVSELFNEWELMDDAEKADMRSRVLWTAAQNGGLLGVIGGVLLVAYLFENQLGNNWVGPVMLAGLVGAVVGFLIHKPIVANRLNDQIAKSTTRMQQPEYRRKLAGLGLLRR